MKKLFIVIGTTELDLSIFNQDQLKTKLLSSQIIDFGKIKELFGTKYSRGAIRSTATTAKINSIFDDLIQDRIKEGDLIICIRRHRDTNDLKKYKKYMDDGYQIIALDFRDKNSDSRELLKIPSWITTVTDNFQNYLFPELILDQPEKEIQIIGALMGHLDSSDKALEFVFKSTSEIIIFSGNLFNRSGKNSAIMLDRLQQFTEVTPKSIYFIQNSTEYFLKDWTKFTKGKFKQLGIFIKNNPKVILPDSFYGLKKDKDILKIEPNFWQECPSDFLKAMNVQLDGFSANGNRILNDIFINGSVKIKSPQNINNFISRMLPYYSVKIGTKRIVVSPAIQERDPDILTSQRSIRYGDRKPYLIQEDRINEPSKTISVFNRIDNNRSMYPKTDRFWNLENTEGVQVLTIAGDIIKSSLFERTSEEKEYEAKIAPKQSTDFKSDGTQKSSLLQKFINSDLIDIKDQGRGIVSVNFKEKAFKEQAWSGVVNKARGLYLDITHPSNKVIMRSYDKFFVLGDKNGITKEKLSELSYPLKAFHKSDGHLGMITVDSREHAPQKLIIGSKGSLSGKDQQLFQKEVMKYWNSEVEAIVKDENITLVFETIIDSSTHISKDEPEGIVLLSCVQNHENFKLRNDLYDKIMEAFGKGVRRKRLIFTAEDQLDFRNKLRAYKNSFSRFDKNGVEGIVVEAGNFMFKVKTEWFYTWSSLTKVYNTFIKIKESRGEITESDYQFYLSKAKNDDAKLFINEAFKIAQESKKYLPLELRNKILDNINTN